MSLIDKIDFQANLQIHNMSTVETLSNDLVKIITEYAKESKIYLCELSTYWSNDLKPYYSEYFKSENRAIECGIQKWKESVRGERYKYGGLVSEHMKPRICRYENYVKIFFYGEGGTHHDFIVQIKTVVGKD